ncbi:MAG: MinD/ParA family protein [Oscillospiraceae bacterium]|jgi:flagellar biosynthesis protein FlhG|nr:MinD/ParA family protein [Oscillospiraceae bacterium]
MNDQAGALRQIVANIKGQRARAPGTGARVVVVTSGKGGVGKTNVTVNLALALSRKGLRVLIFDADFGLANVDVVLGVTPAYDLAHVVRYRGDIRDAVCDGPYGVRFISGGSGVRELIRLSAARLAELLDNLLQLDDMADVVLLDTGAGVSDHILSMVGAAQEVVVVTTPEPTSIMDAYALIKFLTERAESGPRVRLVVNRADSEGEAADTLRKVAAVVRLYLRTEIEEMGFILSDPAVSRAVRLQRPFVLSFPQSAAARNIETLAWRFMGTEPERRPGLRAFFTRMAGRQ